MFVLRLYYIKNEEILRIINAEDTIIEEVEYKGETKLYGKIRRIS